jgi:hypothetical protein
MEKLKTSDKISAVNAMIAFFGFVLVIWQIAITNEQIKKSETNQRAQFLAGLQERAFGTSDFQEIFSKIEYGELDVNQDVHGSNEQIQLVSLLSFLEFVAQLEKMKLIRFEDVKEIFGYFIVRVYSSQEVQQYRNYLKRWVAQGKYPENVTFPNFESLAKKIQQKNTSQSMLN